MIFTLGLILIAVTVAMIVLGRPADGVACMTRMPTTPELI